MTRNKFYAGWRWSDNQKTFWRFLYSRDRASSVGACIEVHGGDFYIEDGSMTVSSRVTQYRPYFRIQIPWLCTLMLAFPRFLTHLFGGKKYGFRYDLGVGFVSVYYGRSSYSSNEDKSWHCHVPWQDKRMVRDRYYALDAKTVVKEFYDSNGRLGFDQRYAFENSPDLPKCSYKLIDYDGEVIYATTYIKEMTWKHGRKWCKFLSWFVPDQVRKYADLDFTPCYGRKKHDWKGGTCGHSVDLNAGENLDDAIKRYCAEHELTYVERLPEVYVPPTKPVSPDESLAKGQAVVSS